MNHADKLIISMELTDDLLNTQLYDNIEEYKTLSYSKLQIRRIRRKMPDCYNILFDFETITSGAKHQPYLCWVYNDEIQQGFVGVDNCAIDMFNNLPTDTHAFLLIAHNSDYGCRPILEYLQSVKSYCKQ